MAAIVARCRSSTSTTSPSIADGDRTPTASGVVEAIEPGMGAHGNSLRESSRRGGAVVPGALSDPGAATLADDGRGGGRGGRRRRYRVAAVGRLARRPNRSTPHHAGWVLGHSRRAGRARLGGNDAGDLCGGRRCRADGGAVPPGGIGCRGGPACAGAGPCLWFALLGGQPWLYGLDGGRWGPDPTGVRHPVLD